MATATTLKTHTGKEQHSGAMAQMQTFLVPKAESSRGEVALGAAVRSLQTQGFKDYMVSNALDRTLPERPIISATSNVRTKAAPALIDEVGYWYDTNYLVDGEFIIKVFAQRLNGFGNRKDLGALFLRTRKGAALRQVQFTTTGLSVMAAESRTVIGRFDILNMEEVAALGYLANPMFAYQNAPENVARVFALSVLEEESVALAQYVENVRTDVEGNEVMIRRRRRGRKLAL